jgi:hypothetical protein
MSKPNHYRALLGLLLVALLSIGMRPLLATASWQKAQTATNMPTPNVLATGVAGTLTALVPTNTSNPTPNQTPNVVATQIAGTLTALAPTLTHTATNTATATITPTPTRQSIYLPIVIRSLPPTPTYTPSATNTPPPTYTPTATFTPTLPALVSENETLGNDSAAQADNNPQSQALRYPPTEFTGLTDDDKDYYRVVASAAGRLEVTLFPTTQSGLLQLALRTAEVGNPVLDYRSGVPYTISYDLPSAGTYYIQVYAATPNSASYTLRFTAIP